MLRSQDVATLNSSQYNIGNSHITEEMLKTQEQNKTESKVGKILSTSTQKAVITLVLSMLLSAAVLDLQLYLAPPIGYSLGLQTLSQTYGN